MASTVYQNQAGSSSKSILGAIGTTKGGPNKAGNKKLNNPNSSAPSSMSFDMADEIVEEPQGSDAGGEDTDSSYGSEVNDNYTSECKAAWQMMFSGVLILFRLYSFRFSRVKHVS
jgi:hypothetical protein